MNDNGMSKHNIYKVETDYKYKILIGQLVSTKPSGGAGGPGQGGGAMEPAGQGGGPAVGPRAGAGQGGGPAVGPRAGVGAG